MKEFNMLRLKQYEEYKDCFVVKACLKSGKVIKQNFMGDIKITLSDSIRIGVDQSSSQTGFAIKKSNGEFVCLLDFVNESSLPYNIYKSMLGLKLEQVLFNTRAEMCIVEKMWGGNKNSYEMLSELGEYISGFKYILPNWDRTEVSEILPNVWRSAYLADPRYKGRFTRDKVKIAAMEEGIIRYPFLKDYGYNHRTLRTPNDSFDALGILEGYEEKTFSSDGTMRKVANTIDATNHNYSYKLFDGYGEEVLTTIKESCPSREIVEYEYNNDFPFFENVRKATSVTNKLVMLKIEDPVAKIQLMWRYGVVLNKSKPITLVGWRDNVSSRLDNY